MTVLCARPVADPCGCPGSGFCGTSPPGMNYEGGDCLPGKPGPIPTPGCGGYSSGSPYEGSPDCPPCEEYCIEGCWSIDIVPEGTCSRDAGDLYHYVDPLENPGFYGIMGYANVPCSLNLNGSFETTVTYTGPDPAPKMVRLSVTSSIDLRALNASFSGSNGLGDPLVAYPGDHYISEGTHVRTVSLNSGEAEFSVQVNGNNSWLYGIGAIHNSIRVSFGVAVLPCDDQ